MSATQDEVMNIRKQLEKMTETGDYTQAMDLLQRLTDIDMNLSILTNTRIGYQVNALRKSTTDSEVISQAKSLIKMWKKFVPENGDKKDKKDKDASQDGKGKVDNDKNSSTPKKIGDKPLPPKASQTTDDVRLSCRKLLATALRGDGELPEGTVNTPEELSELIEETIFKNNKSTNPKYKNQVRSRVFNLKDKKKSLSSRECFVWSDSRRKACCNDL